MAAGNGQTGFGGDGGPAVLASFGDADGLAADASGNLYISDFNNNRVREVLTATPTLAATPTSLSFLGTSDGITAAPQPINVTSSLPGLELVASSDSPWLQVPSSIAYAPGSISVSANPTGLAPGTYQGTVSLTSPGLTSTLSTVHVTFRVNSGIDPKLTTDTSTLTFSLTSGASPQTQMLQVSNAGSGQIDFSVLFTGAASAGLNSSISQGMTQPNSPVMLSITADPSKLPVGTSSASLLILGTNLQYVTIPITVTVSPSPQKMALSQGGLTFVAVAGGGVTPPQSFGVLNTGTGSFSWTAQASTMSGGNWLSVSPASGSSSSASLGSATVSANPAGLAPGVYYGLVVVSSAGTVNSPQQFEVVLNVLASAQSAGASAAPSGLIFTAPAGGDSPSSQTFLVTNLNTTAASLTANATTSSGGDWLIVAPDNGSIAAGASQTHHGPAPYRFSVAGCLSSVNSFASWRHGAYGERCLCRGSFRPRCLVLGFGPPHHNRSKLHADATLPRVHFAHPGFRHSGELAVTNRNASGGRLRESDDQRAGRPPISRMAIRGFRWCPCRMGYGRVFGLATT